MFGLGAKKEERREFEDLALPHLDALYGTALRLTHNEKDAEDLVQDTLLRAFRFFHRFERGTNVKAWLFKILTNTFANKYRKRQRERVILDEVQTQHEIDDVRVPDPEAALAARLVSDHVKEALESVPEEFRLAVILADLEDFSYREISEIVDCPIGTVMSRIYRGRRLLQKKLLAYARETGVVPEEKEKEPRLRVVPGLKDE
jgi:RNA polymerase sigma-70 factor (ECF subfamily)